MDSGPPACLQPFCQPTYLRRETPVADVAPEGPLFGVRPHVDLERRVAGERLQADLARRVPTGCGEKGRIDYKADVRLCSFGSHTLHLRGVST